MSSCGNRGRGSLGCREGARVESSSMGSMPNIDISESIGTPIVEIGSQTPMTGDVHYPMSCFVF